MKLGPQFSDFRPLVLTLVLLLGSCKGAQPKMHTIQASFGDTFMTLEVADDLVATPIAGGGVQLVRRDAGLSRRIYEIALAPGGGVSPVPLQQTRGTGENAIRYGVDQNEGGSGGPEVTLIAERHCRDMLVRLRLDVQAEEGVPSNFDAVLDMLANARCSPRT